MKVPKELVDQWWGDWMGCSGVLTQAEYIAQRAAEWAVSQPVSMEPKQKVKETPVHKIDCADWPEPDSGFAKLEAL